MLSVVVGIVIGVAPTILSYEYQRWRERSTRSKENLEEVKQLLVSELGKFVSGWEVFKNTSNMQYEDGLANFRFELDQIGDTIRGILSSSNALLQKDVVDEGMKISGDLASMRYKEFYADGGVSFGEFIKLGNETARRSTELGKRLR